MESLYLLVPLALVLVVIAVRVLFWAVNSGQYDDLKTEGHRILFDDDQTAVSGPASDASAGGDRAADKSMADADSNNPGGGASDGLPPPDDKRPRDPGR